jgi:4-hydroxy-2-oxoheptanedioate aldolase
VHGVQTLLILYVQSASEVVDAVAAAPYATDGASGVSGLTRENCFGCVQGYAERAADDICVIVQRRNKPWTN